MTVPPDDAIGCVTSALPWSRPCSGDSSGNRPVSTAFSGLTSARRVDARGWRLLSPQRRQERAKRLAETGSEEDEGDEGWGEGV
jgi:hypothetical protein